MNCTYIEKYIDDYIEKRLSQSDQVNVERHLGQCAQCSSILSDALNIHETLSTLSIPDPAEDFERRMLSGVRKHYKKGHQDRFFVGFATAMAASLAIWLVSSVFLPFGQLVGQDTISIALNQPSTVRLMLESKKPIDQVTLSVVLSDNIELEGYPGQKQLSWETNLKQGENILALPVIAVHPGESELIAKLNYGEVMKTFRLVLKATPDGAQFYQLKAYEPV